MVNTSRVELNQGIRVFAYLWVIICLIFHIRLVFDSGSSNWPRSFNFTIWLGLDLGHPFSVFASNTECRDPASRIFALYWFFELQHALLSTRLTNPIARHIRLNYLAAKEISFCFYLLLVLLICQIFVEKQIIYFSHFAKITIVIIGVV